MIAKRQQTMRWESELLGLVRPMTARMNRDIIQSITQHLETRLNLPQTVRQTNPAEAARSLQSTLFRLVNQWRADDDELANHIQQLRELYYRTPEGENREQILLTAIEEYSTDWARRLMDVQALSRQFDWEAMEERLAFEQWSLRVRQMVALEILEGLFGGVDSSASEALSLDASDRHTPATVEHLLNALEESRYELVRRQAARSLKAYWANFPAESLALFETYGKRILAVIRNESEDRWTRTTAIDLLGLTDHDDAIEMLLDLIMDEDESGDRFLLRAHAVSTYATWCHDVDQLRAGFLHLMESNETSEYVRLALVEATKQVQPVDMLSFILELANVENSRPEGSHVVRGRLAESVARHMTLIEDDSYSLEQGARFLSWWATRDTNAVVRRVAQEEIEHLLVQCADKRMEGCGAILVEALQRRLTMSDTPGEAERICGIFEAARIATTPHLADLFVSLHAEVTRLNWGQIRRLPRPEGIPASDIMRIFASISRKDAGYYVRIGAQHLWIMRGERFGSRIWRTLHEIRNQRPRKRPDISHRRGRNYRYSNRAHSEILAEVNPTIVPGERRFIEEEGGWARYLPMVDDLLDAVRQPVRLYSSFGCTTLAPPQHGRLWASWKLNTRYGAYNELRFDALREQEQSRQAAYLRTIREACGLAIAFSPWRYELFGIELVLSTERLESFFGEEE